MTSYSSSVYNPRRQKKAKEIEKKRMTHHKDFSPFSYFFTTEIDERTKKKKLRASIGDTHITNCTYFVSYKKEGERNLSFKMTSYVMKAWIGNEFDKVVKGKLKEILEI